MPFDVQGALSAGATPAQIADEMGKTAGFDTAAARQSGVSDQAMINEMQSKAGSPTHDTAADNSYMNDLKSGVGGAMQDLGGLAQGVGLTSAGSWLRNNATQPDAGYTGRGGDFLPDLKAGQFSRAAGDLSHGLAAGSSESALEAAGAVGGGVLGSVIGPEGTAAGAIGGGVGAGAIGGALSLGRHARLAAANRAVTGSDLANAAPAAAGDAVISGLTMGRVPGGTIGRTVAQGAGGAAQSTLDQYADTGTVDPNQVANAAASGAAFGAVTGAGSDVKAGAGRLSDRIQSSGEQYQPTDASQTRSAIRTRDALVQAQQDGSGTPGAVTGPNAAANNLKSVWTNDAQDRIAQMKVQGASPEALRDAQDLLNRAQRHNNTLYTSDLDILDQGDHGLDAGQLQDLKDRLQDLNTISTNSFKNRNVGPLQSLGSKIGQFAAPAYELYQGNIPGAAAAALLGHTGVPGKVLGAVGAAGDRLLGTSKPTIMLAGQAADRANNGVPVAPVNPITSTNFVPQAKPLPAPPIQRAHPLVGTPLPAPPVQAPAAPLVGKPLAPPPITPAADPRMAGLMASMGGAARDTHGRLINDQGAFDSAIQAYRGNAMRAAQAADMEAPGAGLGDIITGIMDAHHHGFADASLPPAAQAAERAATRAKTVAMKKGMAAAAMSMLPPEHQAILQKHLTTAITNHG